MDSHYDLSSLLHEDAPRTKMVSKTLVVVVLVILHAATITVVEACQAAPSAPYTAADAPLQRPTPKEADFEDAIKQCLKANNVSDTAVSGVEQGDLQCIVKYAWTQPDCSAKPFLKKATDYRDIYGYDEPKLGTFNIDKSCTKGQGGGKGYFLTLWYCLEYCESKCKGGAPNKYPVTDVSCAIQGSGKGCDETHKCTCKRGGSQCADPKDITFKEMLLAYKDSCLNCKNGRSKNDADPLKVCVPGTEPSNFMKKPKTAFDTYKQYYQAHKG